jgi:predicted RNA-binding protein with RPS1 domain
VAIDDAWARSAWPWLVGLAQSVGVPVPDGDPADEITTLLLLLADVAQKTDGTSNAYVLSYSLGILGPSAHLKENAALLVRCAGCIDESTTTPAADQLATTANPFFLNVESTSALTEAIAGALLRCPPTAAVSAALESFDHLVTAKAPPPPPPPPPPSAVTGMIAIPPETVSQAGSPTPSTSDGLVHALGSDEEEARKDPWLAFCVAHPVGSEVDGRVTGTVEYGAFVSLAPGVNGLAHISELSERMVRTVSDIVRVGQNVRVRVISVDQERKRVSLSLKGVDQPAATDPGTQPSSGSGSGSHEGAAASFVDTAHG